MPQGRRAHEPVELTLRVRRRPEGGLVLTSPLCPGWAVPASSPAELAHRVEQAWAEATIAAYARWRGALYDLAETEDELPPAAHPAGSLHPAEPRPVPVDEVAQRRRVKHPRTHPPEEWVELSDGYWRSPTGRRYRPDAAIVASVRAARGR